MEIKVVAQRDLFGQIILRIFFVTGTGERDASMHIPLSDEEAAMLSHALQSELQDKQIERQRNRCTCLPGLPISSDCPVHDDPPKIKCRYRSKNGRRCLARGQMALIEHKHWFDERIVFDLSKKGEGKK